MGYGKIFRCKKCGYVYEMFTGIGMAYPMVYEETMETARNGELGETLKSFVIEHSDCALDISRAPYVCEKCGLYSNADRLDAYLPKPSTKVDEKETQIWSIAFSGKGYQYVTPHEIETKYDLALEYQHYCQNCGGKLRELTDDELDKGLECPQCCSRMEEIDEVHWD